MVAIARLREAKPPLSAARIPIDDFERMRRENLARWPTGALVDIDEAVAYHRALPLHKQLAWVMRKADAEGRCLTQPRGGFGTLELQLELMRELDTAGMADIVPTTTDSYTRNEQWANAERGIEESRKAGRSMLNGFPMVNYGPRETRKLIEAIDKPAIVLSGTSFPRLTSEVGYAAGFSGYLGSGLAYTVSYTKETSLEEGIRNYQYLDRLAALYASKGVELHRRQPGFLTGTNIPPSIAIITCIIDALLAAGQGVKHYGLELGQTLHLVQDAAAIRMCRALVQEYLVKFGFTDVFTPVTSLHWMGAWPHDEAQASALIAYGGTLAAVRWRRVDHHQVDARGLWDSHAEGERRRLAHDAHGDLSRAQPEGRFDAGVRQRMRSDPPRGRAGSRQDPGDGRRGRRPRHDPRRGGRRSRHSLVAEPLGQEPHHAGTRRGWLLAHSLARRHAHSPRCAPGP